MRTVLGGENTAPCGQTSQLGGVSKNALERDLPNHDLFLAVVDGVDLGYDASSVVEVAKNIADVVVVDVHRQGHLRFEYDDFAFSRRPQKFLYGEVCRGPDRARLIVSVAVFRRNLTIVASVKKVGVNQLVID